MAIDPPYRFDPWQNLVNVSWGGAVRFKGHFTISHTIGPGGCVILGEPNQVYTSLGWAHGEATFGDLFNEGEPTIPDVPYYWIWQAIYGAPHSRSNHNIDGDALFSDGCAFATRDITAWFSTPSAVDSYNWHLDGSIGFTARGDGTGFIDVIWNVWRWFGFNETLIEGDPGYHPESYYTTAPERSWTLGWVPFNSGEWGDPTIL